MLWALIAMNRHTTQGRSDLVRRERTQVCLSRQPMNYAALGTGCALLQCLGQLTIASLWRR